MIRLIILLIICPQILLGQCPTSTVQLNSKADVDDFAIDYPNCTELNTSLYIEGADIHDLTPLSNLTHLHMGLLCLDNLLLPILIGLNNVVTMNGIVLLGNNLLTDLQELNALEKVLSQFQIESNLSLESFSGLEELDSINNQFFIFNNIELTNISAIENLEYIGGNIILTNCFELSECSINSFCDFIESTPGNAFISNNGDGCNSISDRSRMSSMLNDKCLDWTTVWFVA